MNKLGLSWTKLSTSWNKLNFQMNYKSNLTLQWRKQSQLEPVSQNPPSNRERTEAEPLM